ncbi:MAG TPA: DUF4384 domain-containing protein [Pyrinomonadaceae bacterium]|nr:DUF4384 domain-containing protein [Pyrinomonadaceae bacterium]
MKKVFLLMAVAGVTTFAVLPYSADAQDEDVRGAFMTTRPKANERPARRPARAVRRRPKTTIPPPNAGSPGSSETKKSNTTEPVKPRVREQKLGIGLTLYMRDSNGLSLRVDPSREFRQNDRVRLLLETNADGFLYVFNTTDDGAPVMIYPDPELDEGGNYIQAHVPVEVPSGVAAEERLRWFRFDAQPGTERLYFVFTREPLAGIPLEDELIGFCKDGGAKCPLRPAAELWAEVQKNSTAPAQTAKSKEFGTAQTTNEQEATTRGIGLNKDDPEPSLVMMTASSSANILVATLELLHK